MSRLFCVLAAFLTLTPLSALGQKTTAAPVDPVAQIQDVHHQSVTRGGVSGSDLDGEHILMVPDGGWVYGIEMGESGDKPCQIKLLWATIDNGNLSTAETNYSPCSPTRSSRRGIEFDIHAPRASADYWYLTGVDGLKVCQRNSNDRVKGLYLSGRRLQPAPRILVSTTQIPTMVNNSADRRRDGQRPTFERTNCNDWEHDFDMCPTNTLVVGLQLEYDRSRSPASIKGMAPICARLQIVR